MSLNVDVIRRDFPILDQEVNGHRLVYLDSAATSQKPRAVIDALVRYYERDNSNIHRGIHTLAQRATEQYEGVREKVARFIGAPNPRDIVFTRNTTEAINLVAHSWGEHRIGEGDEIVISEMEHHSNIVPWQLLAARTGAVMRFARVDADGKLVISPRSAREPSPPGPLSRLPLVAGEGESLAELINERTKLVSLVHVSNVLGTINPVREIAEMAHTAGALVLLDAAQSVPHMPVNVLELGADFVAFSSHKMLGPTGVGVLWAREGLLDEMGPFMGGGEMISVVREEGSTWANVPHKFEAGTPNIADVIAFGAAIEYLEGLGMDAVRAHEVELTGYAMDELEKLPGLTIHGPRDPNERGGVVSFALEGIHPHDISTIVDGHGVAIRAGHHCAQLLMRALGVPATSRASFSVYNGPDDVDALVAALKHAQEVFA